MYNFFPLQYYYLTGSTATTFLEYIQRNLPEGVAMKVTKVNIFSKTYMYYTGTYIKRSSLHLFNSLVYSFIDIFFLNFMNCVIFFSRLKLVFKLIKKVTLENFKTMDLCVKWKTFDTLVYDSLILVNNLLYKVILNHLDNDITVLLSSVYETEIWWSPLLWSATAPSPHFTFFLLYMYAVALNTLSMSAVSTELVNIRIKQSL